MGVYWKYIAFYEIHNEIPFSKTQKEVPKNVDEFNNYRKMKLF